MRIAYVARHGSGRADDEGAIYHALLVLGHDVKCVWDGAVSLSDLSDADLILWNKWDAPVAIRRLKAVKAFWYFDLVDWPSDNTLQVRNRSRINWMIRNIPVADVGFCTDGDWAARYPDKLVWLPQGADERIVGKGVTLDQPHLRREILLTGIRQGGGRGRIDFVDWLEKTYRGRVTHILWGMYRDVLRDITASHVVTVCPDSPVTDRYWSNRVWNACGFGACVLHPAGIGIERCYQHPTEIILYTDRSNLQSKLDWALSASNRNHVQDIGKAALYRTMKDHLYRHRCQKMLDVIRERFGVA